MTLYASDHQSPQPLYVQIRQALKQRILDGHYKPYERLPSEQELMQAYGVSRITVRQALKDLHNEGLVFSAQGKGTFVSRARAVQDVQHLEGFEEAMTRKGYATSARVVGLHRIAANADVREALRLPPGAQVIELRRVRYLNREPVSVDLSYFAESIGSRLIGRDLSGDVFPLLENQLGIPLGHADLLLEARACGPREAELLRIEPGQPVLQVRRLTHDQAGNPIDFEYLTIRSDAYQYRFRIDRK